MRYSHSHMGKTPANNLNPLKQNLTFAFRTRELQALLLFSKDHMQNVIQIYLSTPYEITLLWNTEFTLQKLVINTKDIGTFLSV